jgi:hypothetical protein
MPFSHRIEDSILVFDVTGTYTVKEQNELGEVGPPIVKSHSLLGVIFNFKDADTSATSKIFNIYEVTEKLGEIYSRGTNFAIIPSSDKLSTDHKHQVFFENVAHNRAIKVSVVPDFDTAKKWLQEQ